MSQRAFCTLSIALVALTGCGGSDVACVVDNDCPLFQRCEAEACVPLGQNDTGVADTGPRDSGPDAGPDAGPPVVRSGTIVYIETSSAGVVTHVARAAFREGDNGCTVVDVAGCTVTDCPDPPVADAGLVDSGVPDTGVLDAGAPPPVPHTSDILLRGGTPTVTMTPIADGTYPQVMGTGPLWAAGDMREVRSLGDTIPSFTVSLTGPALVQVSAPVFPALAPIPRTVPLTLTWTPPATPSAPVVVSMSEVTTLSPNAILCSFDSSLGTADVPTAALARLAPGATAFNIVTADTTSPTPAPGGWQITVGLITIATTPVGAPVSGAINLM